MTKKILIIVTIFAVIICFYRLDGKAANKGDYKITNINIFKNTPVWDLALAVNDQRLSRITQKVHKNPHLLNYQEPKYGATLLLWAIGMEKYKSAEALLKCGANPNIASTSEGETPLFLAAGYSWIDTEAKKDPKYVKLLLHYGADPNKNYMGSSKEESGIEPGTSPLMRSIRCGIGKTKDLVEAGATIDYKTKLGTTAAIEALFAKEYPEFAYYLIVQKKAKVSMFYYNKYCYSNPTKQFFPVDLLRDWIFDLNSKEYKMKMEIVKEFARQGVNYWDTKIDKFTLEHIKKLYPNTWEEYIQKY
jgi:hypothetical protein